MVQLLEVVGVEDGKLGATNTLFNVALHEDGVTESFRPGLPEWLSFRVNRVPQRHNTLPFPVAPRKAAFSGTPEDASKRALLNIASATHLVQVPAARGSVMPEIDSMSDDFPALWFPMTAICGKSMSTWTLHKGQHIYVKYNMNNLTQCYAACSSRPTFVEFHG